MTLSGRSFGFMKIVNMHIPYLVLSLLLSVQAVSDLAQQPKWSEDGWQAGFGSAHCYLANSYIDQNDEKIGIVNINFVQIADRKLAESEYDFWLWNALDRMGIKQDELFFTASLPGKVSWEGELRQNYTTSLSVGGLNTQSVETKGLGKDVEEQAWFVMREPDSKRLIEMFSAEQAIEFDMRFKDDSQASFEYRTSPDIDFKVRRAMFEACLSVLSPDSATK